MRSNRSQKGSPPGFQPGAALVTALAIAALASGAGAAERDPRGLDLSGDATADLAWSVTEPFAAGVGEGIYLGGISSRLNAIGGDRTNSKVEASAIARLAWGPSVDDGTLPAVSLEVKKLFLSIYTDLADISVGRMIVNYGRGDVFSPVDLFSGVDVDDLALGRTGTDALRVLVPLGALSGLDLVASLSDSPDDATAGARAYANAAGWDFGLSAFRVAGPAPEGDFLAIGADLKGDLELGLSSELALRVPFAEPGAPSAQWMFGLDYSLAAAWFLDLEYSWNLPLPGAAAFAFNGAHNLFASLSWKIDELDALDFRAIANLSEAAWQGSLSVARSVADGATASAYAMYRSGDVEGAGVSAVARAMLGIRLSVAY